MSGWRSQEKGFGGGWGEGVTMVIIAPCCLSRERRGCFPLTPGKQEGYQIHSESLILLVFRDHKTDGRLFYLFIYLFLTMMCSLLGGFFSSCGEWGLFSSGILQASHCGSFSCCTVGAAGHAGFRSCSIWALVTAPRL